MVSSQSEALSSVIQHATPSEFGGKWETECLSTRLLLPILLCEHTVIQHEHELYLARIKIMKKSMIVVSRQSLL